MPSRFRILCVVVHYFYKFSRKDKQLFRVIYFLCACAHSLFIQRFSVCRISDCNNFFCLRVCWTMIGYVRITKCKCKIWSFEYRTRHSLRKFEVAVVRDFQILLLLLQLLLLLLLMLLLLLLLLLVLLLHITKYAGKLMIPPTHILHRRWKLNTLNYVIQIKFSSLKKHPKISGRLYRL